MYSFSFSGLPLKSIIYAGEGEPLLHKDAPEILIKTKRMGIDAAMSTNGVLFSPEIARDCMKTLTWMRFTLLPAFQCPSFPDYNLPEEAGRSVDAAKKALS